MNVNAILVQMGLDWTTDNIELNGPNLLPCPALGWYISMELWYNEWGGDRGEVTLVGPECVNSPFSPHLLPCWGSLLPCAGQFNPQCRGVYLDTGSCLTWKVTWDNDSQWQSVTSAVLHTSLLPLFLVLIFEGGENDDDNVSFLH